MEEAAAVAAANPKKKRKKKPTYPVGFLFVRYEQVVVMIWNVKIG